MRHWLLIVVRHGDACPADDLANLGTLCDCNTNLIAKAMRRERYARQQILTQLWLDARGTKLAEGPSSRNRLQGTAQKQPIQLLESISAQDEAAKTTCYIIDSRGSLVAMHKANCYPTRQLCHEGRAAQISILIQGLLKGT